jgi:hypothetical protein
MSKPWKKWFFLLENDSGLLMLEDESFLILELGLN